MNASPILPALTPVVTAFDRLGIAYFIGGSIASSYHGLARTTSDVDVVADLREHHVGALIEALRSGYYVDESMIREAIRTRGSFNVIHFDTMLKIDIFILKPDAYDQIAFSRAARASLSESSSPSFRVAASEDVILHKLYWYRLGGDVSERQWGDVLGVLKVQRDALDLPYMKTWAARLRISELLDRALIEAGILPDTP
ncbi:hypothetical protein [Rhodocaloribacter sp.]